MSMSINSVISNYTYTYQNKLQPKLDKDENGYLSQPEVNNYVQSYNEATGRSLDADQIMASYDSDGDGRLNYAEQDSLIQGDGLGLDYLNRLRIEANTVQVNATAEPSAGGSKTVDSGELSALIEKYAYNYGGKLHPKLDQDEDGYWSREELDTFAAEYEEVTGNRLDVDALMSTYDNDSDGRLAYGEQEAARAADAVGMGALLELKQSAGSSSTSSGSSSTVSSSSSVTLDDVNSFIDKYTYTFKGGLQISQRMDEDSDGYFSKGELQTYADAYKGITGSSLDVDSIMEKYDSDSDGLLSYTEQESASKAGAFGLSKVSSLQAELMTSEATKAAEAKAKEPAKEEKDNSTAIQNMDWFNSLSSVKKVALYNMVARAEQTSYFLSTLNTASLGYNAYASNSLWGGSSLTSNSLMNMWA